VLSALSTHDLQGINITLEVDHNKYQFEWKSPDFKYGEMLSGKLKVKVLLRRSRFSNRKFISWHHSEQHDVLLLLEAHWDYNEERDPGV
jgi:hypothetical protein